jgi:hypothetical protein
MMLLSKIRVIDSPLWHSPAMGSWSGLQYPAGILSCVAGLCLIKRLLVSPRTFLTLLFQHKFLAKQVIIEVCRSHGWVVHTVDVPTPQSLQSTLWYDESQQGELNIGASFISLSIVIKRVLHQYGITIKFRWTKSHGNSLYCFRSL